MCLVVHMRGSYCSNSSLSFFSLTNWRFFTLLQRSHKAHSSVTPNIKNYESSNIIKIMTIQIYANVYSGIITAQSLLEFTQIT